MDRAPTVIEAVKMSEGYLARHGVESARLSAEHLLAKALGCTRLDLYLRFEETLGEPVLGEYRSDLKRRASRIPLQYILGEVEFRSLTLKIKEDVFIPRPETELLVEFAAELMSGREAVRFIEFGTGSGAISGALASAGPHWTGIAFDISPGAAALAAANIDALGISDRVEVHRLRRIRRFRRRRGVRSRSLESSIHTCRRYRRPPGGGRLVGEPCRSRRRGGRVVLLSR